MKVFWEILFKTKLSSLFCMIFFLLTLDDHDDDDYDELLLRNYLIYGRHLALFPARTLSRTRREHDLNICETRLQILLNDLNNLLNLIVLLS